MPTRRQFLATTFAFAAGHQLPLFAQGTAKKLRIGIITDVHKDIIPDADERLQAFITAMNAAQVDAVLQMGDFCVPKPANQGFLDIFNQFAGPRYHVIGNHDMDGRFTREQTMKFWGMKERFYSFDLGGFHFIVLDANDRPEGWKAGYPHYIAADQVEWLKRDLAATSLNTFIFSHQSFERPMCIDNQEEVRAVLEAAKLPDGRRKVAACLNGHWHIDHQRTIQGIPYIHINSAAYFYMGGKFKQGRIDPELAKGRPLIATAADYASTLFTVLEIDPTAGTFATQGMKTTWLGPSPQELNYTSKEVENAWVQPAITAGQWKLGQS